MTDTRFFVVPTGLTWSAVACHSRQPRLTCQKKTALHDLSVAEAFLDWLERSGYTDRSLSIDGHSFVVRWRAEK